MAGRLVVGHESKIALSSSSVCEGVSDDWWVDCWGLVGNGDGRELLSKGSCWGSGYCFKQLKALGHGFLFFKILVPSFHTVVDVIDVDVSDCL